MLETLSCDDPGHFHLRSAADARSRLENMGFRAPEWRVLVNSARPQGLKLDIAAPDAGDNRRLEVVADGLPLFHGAQFTTMVSLLSRIGLPHARCADVDGAATVAARRRKERRCPELSGEEGRARLKLFVCEVGGRFPEECRHFLSQLSKFKARDEPPLLQQRVHHAWLSVGGRCWFAAVSALWPCRCWSGAEDMARRASSFEP